MVILLKQYCVIRITQVTLYELRSMVSRIYLMLKRWLFDEERKHDQDHEERTSQYTDTTEVAFDMSVIGVELGGGTFS